MMRIAAARVIARRRLLETFISPGFYIALTIGLLLGYFLVAGFTGTIDSSGFNLELNPVYDLITRSLQGAFGLTFVHQLFAEGPFLFALYISFIPVLLYLSVSSVFSFGLEKKVGAIELLAYGPADGTSYFLASYIKDVLLTVLAMLILFLFMGIAAVINNLLLGPMFFYSMLLIFIISLSIYAYGVLASVLTNYAGSAIALFIGAMLFFLFIIMGAFVIVSRYVQSLSNVLAWIIKWLSPFYYWDLGLRAVGAGNTLFFLLSLLILLLLSGLILFISHLSIKARGVRG
ncbi:hypothetical protein ES703_31883 [subsurface metagenome]